MGQAAANTASGVAANSKYLIAGALVGAAAGAAYEASQKGSDAKGKSKSKGKGRKRSSTDRSDEGLMNFASRAIDAVGGFAAQVGDLALQGVEAIRGGQDDGADQAASAESEPQNAQPDDDQDADEPGIEIVRGQTVTGDLAEDDWEDDDRPIRAGADLVEDETGEQSDESGAIINRRKRRGNEVHPEIERSWSA